MILVRPEYASNVRVLREELIHAYQQGAGFEVGAGERSVIQAEIAAREAMIRNARQWGITKAEVQEMLREIEQMRKTGRY